VSPTPAERKAARLERREQALALRETMSPTGPAPDRLRVATWNLNSLRTRLAGVERLLERARPDVLCLQETKTTELTDAATTAFERLGYHAAHVGRGGYNGVAVLARHPIGAVEAAGDLGDEHLDLEPRLIAAVVETPEPVRVASVYVPHGRKVGDPHYEYKLAFLDALAARVERWLRDDVRLVLAGDVNVAPTNSDIFHPDAFVGLTHVTAPEREALQRVLDAGLVDVDAAVWGPRARRFTWWNYGIGYSRNLGMRIDLIAADHALAERLDTTWIDHVERGVRPSSDHAALVADFRLPVR
jgi:exodeoxyribonuclease-3